MTAIGRKLRRRLPRSAWKMAVSLMTFVVTFFVVTFLLRKDQNQILWSTCVGLFVAGVSFVAQFLFDVEEAVTENREAQKEQERNTSARIDERFRQIGEATTLYADLQRSLVGLEAFQDVVRGLDALAGAPALAQALIVTEFDRLRRLTRALAEGGYATYSGEDRDWLLTLTAQRLGSVDSVSIVSIEGHNQLIVDGGPWRSDRARRFFDAQAEAIEPKPGPGTTPEPAAGTLVRRVFVVRDEKVAQMAEFVELCASQEAVGMHIRVLDLSTARGRQYQTISEFILFDRQASYEPSPDARTVYGERPVLVTTRLDFDPKRIDRLSRLFERLWQHLGEPPDDDSYGREA